MYYNFETCEYLIGGDTLVLLEDENGDKFVATEEEFNNDFVICCDCGRAFLRNRMTSIEKDIENDTGVICCEDCYDEQSDRRGSGCIGWCEGHEEYEFADGWCWAEAVDGWVCYDFAENELIQCNHCNEYFFPDQGHWDDDDRFYCEDCCDRGYGYWHDDDYEDYDVNDPHVCSYHADCHSEIKTEFIDSRDRKSEPHCGFELEVHKADGYVSPDDVVEVDESLNGIVVYESDCSIEPGFEIISRPASMTYWLEMENFDRIKQACKKLIKLGYNSHNSNMCGLHIHLDRTFFGNPGNRTRQELVEAKFLYLFLRHWENIVRFSRRKSFGYCHKSRVDGENVSIKEMVKSSNYARGHYTAINCSHYDTIEIRIWRGTLRPETLLATLKFTQRLAEIIKANNIMSLSKMSWEEILGDDPDILAYWETVKDRELPDGMNN